MSGLHWSFCCFVGFFYVQWSIFRFVFRVSLVCEKELNLMLKVSETSSQGAVGTKHESGEI